MTPQLVPIETAADELGVPKSSLRSAAEEHGFLVRMGRAIRIDRNDYGRLVKKCQDIARTNVETGKLRMNSYPT